MDDYGRAQARKRKIYDMQDQAVRDTKVMADRLAARTAGESRWGSTGRGMVARYLPGQEQTGPPRGAGGCACWEATAPGRQPARCLSVFRTADMIGIEGHVSFLTPKKKHIIFRVILTKHTARFCDRSAHSVFTAWSCMPKLSMSGPEFFRSRPCLRSYSQARQFHLVRVGSQVSACRFEVISRGEVHLELFPCP